MAGLIPAHAGKTKARAMPAIITDGSSPLTRGKPEPLPGLVVENRLIPAHAGKTGIDGLHWGLLQAHPRSRGENEAEAVHCGCEGGSSPLTRGKPMLKHR